jgi:hypothetical protein
MALKTNDTAVDVEYVPMLFNKFINFNLRKNFL